MSAKRYAWPRWLGAALGTWALCAGVQARDWEDIMATPFVDPLFTRPSLLEAGKALPGDPQVHGCDGVRYEFAKPLALIDAIDLALCHNPQVQSTWASIKVQSAQVGEARAAYFPTITAGVSQQSQKSRYPESQFQVNTDRTSESQFYSLTWRLLDFGGRGANRRSANALLEAALASHDAMLQKTMANVIGLYFDVQTARGGREAKEANEALARQTLEAARKREARGAGAQSDTLQAQTSLAKTELEHARAVGLYEKSLVALTVAMGLQAQWVEAQGINAQPFDLAPDYHDDVTVVQRDLREWLKIAQEQHPAIVAARAQFESAKERVKTIRSEGLPTLDFSQSEYVNGRPNQGLSSTQSTESVVGVTLNIPLFDGFARSYKVRGAQAQIDGKESELRDTQNQVLGDVAKAHADTLSALRNLQSSRQLLNAAEEALENVRRKFDRGVSDVLEMLHVQSALADAWQERIRALSEWRAARLRLLANAGTLGLKDLQKN